MAWFLASFYGWQLHRASINEFNGVVRRYCLREFRLEGGEDVGEGSPGGDFLGGEGDVEVFREGHYELDVGEGIPGFDVGGGGLGGEVDGVEVHYITEDGGDFLNELFVSHGWGCPWG